MKILIVDDESLALERLRRLLNEAGEFLVYAAQSGKEALEIVEKDPLFDLAFIDIKMPEISGLELAYRISLINDGIFIVFQTAYEEYAVEAFKVGAIDYLLKPYSLEDVKRVLKRVEKFKKFENKQKFLVKDLEGKYKILSPEQIYYIKAELKESMLRTKDDYIYYPLSISKLEEKLKTQNFFRIHKSYLINLDKIERIERAEQSKLIFQFKDINERVVSSKEGGKLFREKFKGFPYLDSRES